MTYEEIVEYILNVPKFTKKNTMEDTRRFYDFLGAPSEQKKIIHVAGTNGKGSVCAYLNQILVESGYSVGMFTSPHLVSIEERFQINGLQISKEKFEKTFLELLKQIKRYQIKYADYHPTFFEILFFISMIYFEKEDVKVILLETGLGGRLDATNIIRKPMICVITKIGLDHTEYLGNTLEDVAYEKSGIIKSEIPVVAWNTNQKVHDVIWKKAKEQHAEVHFSELSDVGRIENKDKKIDFYYKSSYYRSMHCKINSVADYQVCNASLAIKVCEVLSDRMDLSEENIQAGLENTFWPGRMEEIETDVIVDGAHNVDGIKTFLQGSSFEKEEKSILLFSVVKEKNNEDMIELLSRSGKFSLVCITKIPGSRGMDSKLIADEFRKYVDDSKTEIVVKENIEEAYLYCKNQRTVRQKLYVLGSLYLIGEVKSIYK